MDVRLLLLIICHFVFGSLFCQAQQISVDKFTVVPIDKADKVKKKRVIDLYTKEEGYSFSSPSQDIEVKNEDGFSRLIVNKEVRYIKIAHPQYGTLNWRIPVSKLKSRKLYKAEIVSPGSFEYKQQHQWLKIVCPYKDAIVIVDSLYQKATMDGLQLLLPIGTYTIKTMAAFFKDRTDTIVLKQGSPYEYNVKLVPDYSYLRVSYNADSIKVYLDHKEESRESLRRKKLASGTHYLYAKYNDLEYSREFELEPSEFKEIALDTGDFYKHKRLRSEKLEKTAGQPMEVPYALDSIPVAIKAFDERCRIYINNEYVTDGFWSGYLRRGDYLISNKRDALTSKPVFVHIEEQDKLDLKLDSPASNYGMLNIESNVLNADIYLDGWYVGKTPYIIKDLDTDMEHTIVLRKTGYKLLEKKVRITPNDETRIVLMLHKK